LNAVLPSLDVTVTNSTGRSSLTTWVFYSSAVLNENGFSLTPSFQYVRLEPEHFQNLRCIKENTSFVSTSFLAGDIMLSFAFESRMLSSENGQKKDTLEERGLPMLTIHQDSHPILSDYIQAAMSTMEVKCLASGEWFASIPLCPGVWASADSPEAARAEIAEVLEEWIVFTLSDGDALPPIGTHRVEIHRVVEPD
jgi:predicted RNase H-like HicB family nuclease